MMAQPGGKDRAERVGERVRAELMELLLRGEVRDPGAEGLFVSAVRVSKDLKYARVYLRLTDTHLDEARRDAALRAVDRASGFLRRSIAPRLKLRYVPELRFFWDETTDDAARIEALLAGDRRSATEDDDPDSEGES